jgi:hypothetical protein
MKQDLPNNQSPNFKCYKVPCKSIVYKQHMDHQHQTLKPSLKWNQYSWNNCQTLYGQNKNVHETTNLVFIKHTQIMKHQTLDHQYFIVPCSQHIWYPCWCLGWYMAKAYIPNQHWYIPKLMTNGYLSIVPKNHPTLV